MMTPKLQKYLGDTVEELATSITLASIPGSIDADTGDALLNQLAVLRDIIKGRPSSTHRHSVKAEADSFMRDVARGMSDDELASVLAVTTKTETEQS
jgi:hypothetical protein